MLKELKKLTIKSIKALKEDNKIKFTIFIFSTPDVHKITNSLSLMCFNVKTTIEIKNARGINLGIIPKIFNSANIPINRKS